MTDKQFSNILIDDISSLENAKSNEISFFSNISYKKELKDTEAGACIIKPDWSHLAPKNMPLVLIDDAYLGFALISQKFYPSETKPHQLTGIKKKYEHRNQDNITLGENVVVECQYLSDQYGTRFNPPKIIKELANSGRKFYN